MEIIIGLIAFIFGGILTYFIVKSKFSSGVSKDEINKDYVSRETFEFSQREYDKTKTELAIQTEALNNSRLDLVALQAKESAQSEKMANFKQEIEELQKNAHNEFRVLANSVFDEKRKAFVDENKKEITTILDPFKSDLNAFKTKIEETRKEDIQDLTSLKHEIIDLQKLNSKLSDDAKNLATALKGDVKMQGNWGEDRLLTILEAEGLQKHIDFEKEFSVTDDELKKQRPDYVLSLPGDRKIIIDVKVSLTAYVNYFNADSLELKKSALSDHLKSVKSHIDSLGNKNYQALTGLKTPDYIFLFMPIESALTLALNEEPQIFESALKRQIVLITPTTFVSTMKIVKLIWQRENQNTQVEEVFRICGELYNKFLMMLEEMTKLENALDTAQSAYKGVKNHLSEGSKKGVTIIGRMEKISQLQNKSNKGIPEKFARDLDKLPDEIDEKYDAIEDAEFESNELNNEPSE